MRCGSIRFQRPNSKKRHARGPRPFGQYRFGDSCPLCRLTNTFPGSIKVLRARRVPGPRRGAMVRNRLLILLGGCFLAASAAWANDVGYVDCSNHSDDTQVFGKARRSTHAVASLPRGERFTILVYGFVFSRIQTTDGKVGYVYSNLIAVDRSANPVLQPASSPTPRYRPRTPETTPAVAQPNPPAPAQPQPASAQPAPPQPAIRTSRPPATTATVPRPDPFAAAQPQPGPAQPMSAQPAPAQPVVGTFSAPETTATIAQPAPFAAAQPQPTSSQPGPAQPAPAEAAAGTPL